MTKEDHVHRHYEASMLSVEEALKRVLGFFRTLETEEKPILQALGQVLAENTISTVDIPPWNNSAMDGYAVRFEDILGATGLAPRFLKIIGNVAAGQIPTVEVTPGTAIKIMTGAPIPKGANTIVAFEDTDEIERKTSGKDLTEIGITANIIKGADIRNAGEDVCNGQRIFTKGTLLRPGEIGVLASLGLSKVKVIRRPVIAILATGNELTKPGDILKPGTIYNSNNYSIAASVLRYGGIPKVLGIAKDNLKSIQEKLAKGLESDFLLTSAGVSKGDYDIVKDVLAKHGKIDFWSVRMRPAKPLAFGVLHSQKNGRKVPHLGLPGNPVSAMVAFEEFARPAIYKMMGKTNFKKPIIKAILNEPIHNLDGRRVYARAIVTKKNGCYFASLTRHQGSGILTSMADANGLAICHEDIPEKKAGETVEVQMLDWPEEVF